MEITFSHEFIKTFLSDMIIASYLCYAGGIIASLFYFHYKRKGWERLEKKSVYFATPLFFFAATINIFIYVLI
jgi:hypothetical protein